jgi:hypothetical protein
MIKRVLFNKSHLDIIDLQEEFKPILGLEGIRFILDKLPLPGADGVTLTCDGKILCCFGFITRVPGVVEVWLFPSIYVRDHSIVFVREINGYIESTAQVLNWHRVQTLTPDNLLHRKWMRILGFVEEGTMRKYHEKKDYIMSARYFDWSNP